jgi:glycosyltransferase involved in cell wall biosynthesis
MPKLILNTIVKNESHCIIGMLEAAAKISDAIVIADTGSTDGTQDLIRKFGEDNNIPTYVFERPFDDFEKSRNFGMQKARDVVNELGWNPNDCWTWWCDADEKIVVEDKFDKSQFKNDLYMINTYIGQMKYTRNTFARVSKPFRFYGPVHEFIVCDEQNITSGLAENVFVDVKMIGSSWQGDISQKYLDHAHKLEAYIAKDRKDPRWIFYTAQSYHDSASMKDNNEENVERLRRSMKYYKERVKRNDGYAEENYYSQYRVGTIMRILEEPWNLTHMELLKAYSMDPLRGESIKVIIDYYLQIGDWNMAYLYSKFAKSNFHGKNPYPTRLLFVDEAIYVWKFAESHAATCYYTNRMQEAKETFKEIIEISKKQPQYFTPEDLKKIEMNSQFFLKN